MISSDTTYQTEDDENSADETVEIKYSEEIDYDADTDFPTFEDSFSDWDYADALGSSEFEDNENETK